MEDELFCTPDVRPKELNEGKFCQDALDQTDLYSFESVLTYLQKEWSRMERERLSWDVERHQLNLKLSALQQEIDSHERIKKDMVQRIKMLEYSIRLERLKSVKSDDIPDKILPPVTCSYSTSVNFGECTTKPMQSRKLARNDNPKPSNGVIEENYEYIDLVEAFSELDAALVNTPVYNHNSSNSKPPPDKITSLMFNTHRECDLQELADLSTADSIDSIDGVSDTASTTSSLVSVINNCQAEENSSSSVMLEPHYLLRGHFDCVRQIVVHPFENTVITASDDGTLKLWSLSKTIQNKKSSNLDVEPLFTLHGHVSPVVSAALWIPPGSFYNTPATVVLSGSVDGSIRSWCLPSTMHLNSIEGFNPRCIGPQFLGQQGCIWCLQTLHPRDQSFLSLSSNGTVFTWPLSCLVDYDLSPGAAYPLSSQTPVFAGPVTAPVQRYQRDSRLTTMCLCSGAKEYFAGGLDGTLSQVCVETNRSLVNFTAIKSAVCSLAWHAPRQVLISGHEDSHLRLWDSRVPAGLVSSWIAHHDWVTGVQVIGEGTVCSASHDASLRFWSMEQRACFHELNGQHRYKNDESISCLAYQSSMSLLASGGADGLAKVYATSNSAGGCALNKSQKFTAML